MTFGEKDKKKSAWYIATLVKLHTQPFQKGWLFCGFVSVPTLKSKQIDFQPDGTEESHVDFEVFCGLEGGLISLAPRQDAGPKMSYGFGRGL